ncbi:P-loop containing nucleoside triphosphate hydrolase protein [Amniculicola lignicola CBS 123094]|uniref:P-loop containing nucleoside triphosphate hydrolase protein n=1 Tax=Amniculicola lignicola CBS 123094 TaxID=1392246 RepID=A0A6A5WX24_9PLEO|nr:P-loop containing nucleoside triphosphate hydrolase protein [Amniculicola lignicola CBS 123094]
MNLRLRQIGALIRKNLLIICVRRPITTFIRAVAIPLVVVLVLAYSKNFFASPRHYGVGNPHPILSLRYALQQSSGHIIVGFIDNDMKNGEVSSVINSISQIVEDAGKTPKLYSSSWEMAQECASDTRGTSKCYGCVIFHSSPDQGSNSSTKGTWNYTLRGDDGAIGGAIDVKSRSNGPQIYLLPLQRAVDEEIIARSRPQNPLPKIDGILFTRGTQAELTESRTSNYLSLCINLFGTIFSFAMIGLVYHMTSFVATERELGMSGLIDTMIPGATAVRGRIARQVSTYISFAMIYLPSWLAVGIVMDNVAFPVTARGVPVAYHIFSGLAFCSFTLFAASFFKKAQLSGSIIVVIALVFSILPQVLFKQSKALVMVFSLFVPSANYTYFVTGLARWELANRKVQLMQDTPSDEGGFAEVELVKLGLHWIFLAFQIVVYPVLAFFTETLLFSTVSPGRKFATPANPTAPTVTVSGFGKTYKGGIFKNVPFLGRVFKSGQDVNAVTNMNLTAYRGQILCLLGPNGSGKSTTLNCITAQHKVTSGSIVIDPAGGLGFAPQNNVIWPELTVEEHIRIFSDLKCTSSVNDEIVTELVKSCDLQDKLPCKAKTLSGGQKRKLQMAMMFAGGSAVCCVDEVSTGLDPISRRRIWEILLAERSRRTIIMTTHFLDEADFLADNIAIMYKGTLKAEGTSATLKNKYGNGYTVKLPHNTDLDMTLSGPVEKESSRHQFVYRVATAGLAAELIDILEEHGIHDYQVSGPTMEELFLKATGDKIHVEESSTPPSESEQTSKQGVQVVASPVSDYQLTDGHPISAFKQWYILFTKRFRILRRRYLPYFVTIAFAIVGAAVAPKLIKSYKKPLSCPVPSELIVDWSYRSDFSSSMYNDYVVGPPSKWNDNMLRQMTTIYSANNTRWGYGFTDVQELKDRLTYVDTYDEFKQYIEDHHASWGVAGGVWLGDNPTIAYNGQVVWLRSPMLMQNFINNIITGVSIDVGFADFATTEIPALFDLKPLIFMIYYGLIMACYPAFFALYPTHERISNVRSMQYSNGIRPLPLWLSHLSFDGMFILIISVIGVALLSISTSLWHGLAYIWLILFLYGIVSALFAYVLSMFARTPVTAWFMAALGQVVMYFAYFGGIIGVQSGTPYQDLESMLNKLYFGLGIISPVVSLERAFTIGLGQFGALCNGHNDGSIYMFGGPICYLVLQGLVLFVILLWWDGSFKLPTLSRRSAREEESDLGSTDLLQELKRLKSTSTDLRIENVSKSFGKNLAVDNVTFGVQTSEIFALLGPNGAGKSTVISMIRGDMKPSTSSSIITIAGHSITQHPVAARANLGVCPQFDSADILTVTETLRFFAKTRGVKNIEHNVSTVIAACGLEDWAHQLAQKLSGGTKRKLSLAVALVGNPRVLVLDEPSSALDANAKRNMWHTLQNISLGRAVVLTTHSMEEADALADRIGIVSSRMLAIGDRETLKRRAGDAFHIHLVSRSAPRTTDAEIQTIKQWIGEEFPNVKIGRETQGGQVRFEVPTEGHGLVGLIKKMEEVKDDLGVEFYTVGRATLDEVFEKIVKRFGDGSVEK